MANKVSEEKKEFARVLYMSGEQQNIIAEKVAGACDKLSKLAATIEKLDKKASVVDAIEVFIGFGKWLQHRATNDEELTPELIKAINRFQDLYVSELLSTKGQ